MSTSKVLLGIVLGAAAGAVAGILMAPDSGANTRKKIADSGRDMTNNLKGKWDHLVDGFTNKMEEVQEEIEPVVNHVRARANEAARKTANS